MSDHPQIITFKSDDAPAGTPNWIARFHEPAHKGPKGVVAAGFLPIEFVGFDQTEVSDKAATWWAEEKAKLARAEASSAARAAARRKDAA